MKVRLLASLAAAGLGVTIVAVPDLTALLVPGLVGVLALVVLVRTLFREPGEVLVSRTILRWTLIAFFAHLVIGSVVNAWPAAQSYLGPDATTYHDYASSLVRHWKEDWPVPDLPAGKEGFFYLLAGAYYVLGSHAIAGIALNAALSAALVPVVADTTRRLVGREATSYAAAIVVVLPGFLVWMSQLLREAAVLLLIAVVANALVRLSSRPRVPPLVICAIALALLFSFRSNVALGLGAAAIIAVVFAHRQLVAGASVGAATLLILVTLIFAAGLGYTGYRLAADSDLRQASLARTELSQSARSGFDLEVDISSPSRAMRYLPEGLVKFLLGPFPLQVQGTRELPALAEAFSLWVVLPSLWRGVRLGRRRVGRRLLVVFIPAATLSVMLALVIGNFGMVLRERLQVVVLLIPLIALGLAHRRPAITTPRSADVQRVPVGQTH